MTQTAKPATVQIVRDGMNLARFEIATGKLLGQILYSEWDGTYSAYHGQRFVLTTESRDLAGRAMVLGR